MKEDYIQYVWKFQLFDVLNLQTVSGKLIEVIHPGFQNFSSGPDFTNARIKINGRLWAGNVEIHKTEKDWYAHSHQNDKAYNNVILHVVYSCTGTTVQTENKRELETLVLKDIIFEKTEKNYYSLMKGEKSFVPCENLIQSDIEYSSLYNGLVTERFQRKIEDISKEVESSQGDLDKAFLVTLFKYFGAPKNKIPFEVLARNINLTHLIKQSVSVINLEAFLFGLAGFLEDHEHCDYNNKLENEFSYIKQLYQYGSNQDRSQWKFSGVRPANFPTLRLAHLAALLFNEQRWFSYIQEEGDILKIREKMKVTASEYWETHYNFGRISEFQEKRLTDAFLDKIMINVIAPFLFYYGRFVDKESYIEKAFDILVNIKPEKNSITNNWHKIGLKNDNALSSQALIELKQSFCDQKLCLKCKIGFKILKNE